MPADEGKLKEIIAELTHAYNAEIETVANYLANSVHLDGAVAEPIKESLAADVEEELGHARRLAERLRVLGADVPGSLDLTWSQKSLQPPKDTTDYATVIDGVIEAEEGAIQRYERLVEMCDGVDFVTQDLVIELLGDEQSHRREFIGFKRALAKT